MQSAMLIIKDKPATTNNLPPGVCWAENAIRHPIVALWKTVLVFLYLQKHLFLLIISIILGSWNRGKHDVLIFQI